MTPHILQSTVFSHGLLGHSSGENKLRVFALQLLNCFAGKMQHWYALLLKHKIVIHNMFDSSEHLLRY